MKYLLLALSLIAILSPVTPLLSSGIGKVYIPNTPPIATATATTQTGASPLNVILDGSGSTDTDGTIVSYSWAWNGGTATGVDPLITLTNVGVYAVILTVTDNEGGTALDAAKIVVSGDSDGDGVDDSEDNCPTVFNPTQELPVYYADIDEDGFGDAGDRFVGCTPPAGATTQTTAQMPTTPPRPTKTGTASATSAIPISG